jgi:hypothetical protein
MITTMAVFIALAVAFAPRFTQYGNLIITWIFITMAWLLSVRVLFTLDRVRARPRRRRVAACCAVGSLLLYGGLGILLARPWETAKTDQRVASQPSQVTDATRERPYVFGRLVIDSVKRDEVNFHLQVENGKVPVRNVLVSYNSGLVVQAEVNRTSVRTLAPGGRISVPGILPNVFYAKQPTSLIVYVSYSAEVDGVNKKFWVRYRFFVQPQDLKPQVIDPESVEEHEGQFEFELDDEQFAKAFSQENGLMAFPISELTDAGNRKLIEVETPDGTTRFVVNAVTRTDSFEMKIRSGRLIKLELPLRQNRTKHQTHQIILGWHVEGFLSLVVDGIEKKEGF